MKILIAEDSTSLRELLKTSLTQKGYEVVACVDGNDAWEQLQHPDSPRLAILDWIMPGLEGVDICRRLRALEDCPRYIILLTSNNTSENIIQGLEAGADDYTVKPYHLDELLARIKTGERILGLQTALAERIAELEITQMRIIQQEKMASIGQLAAGVAHEINNPMGYISSNLCTLDKYIHRLREYITTQDRLLSGHAELAAERSRLKVDLIIGDIAPLIEESREGVGRVRTIVQDLKSFSRVDNSHCQPADINDCIDRSLAVVWNEIKYKATVTKDYGDLPMIPAYPQQLMQVFVNLLINAAQAIDSQGKINISSWLKDDTVCARVGDTGCGIPTEVRQRIFDPFFTTKEVGEGTGLGLSIAYEIIRKHRGQISVESTPGEGTTFTVSLPAAPHVCV